MEITTTYRGFRLGKFADRNGKKCSIQKSSVATEDCIWLGVDDPEPQIMLEGKGWTEFEIPKGVLLSTRMHLTREQVKDLLPILNNFVRTGELLDYKNK